MVYFLVASNTCREHWLIVYGIISQLASKAKVSPKNVSRADQMLPFIMSDKK
jgi:hypothetical protein